MVMGHSSTAVTAKVYVHLYGPRGGRGAVPEGNGRNGLGPLIAGHSPHNLFDVEGERDPYRRCEEADKAHHE